jgi:hypothetical protein
MKCPLCDHNSLWENPENKVLSAFQMLTDNFRVLNCTFKKGTYGASTMVKILKSPIDLRPVAKKGLQHAPRFQLWPDAICFREMAKQAPNTYLSNMCVRNAILLALGRRRQRAESDYARRVVRDWRMISARI